MKKIYTTYLTLFLITLLLAGAAFAMRMLFVGILAVIFAFCIRWIYQLISEKVRQQSCINLNYLYRELRVLNVKDDETLLPFFAAENRRDRFAVFMDMVGKHLDSWPDDKTRDFIQFRQMYNQYQLD